MKKLKTFSLLLVLLGAGNLFSEDAGAVIIFADCDDGPGSNIGASISFTVWCDGGWGPGGSGEGVMVTGQSTATRNVAPFDTAVANRVALLFFSMGNLTRSAILCNSGPSTGVNIVSRTTLWEFSGGALVPNSVSPQASASGVVSNTTSFACIPIF